MACTVASQQEGSEFEPTGRLEPLCVEFVCGVCMFSLRGFSPGTLASSHNPKNTQVRLTGDSKLPVNVNVSVSSLQSLYVSRVTDWRPVQGAPRLSPSASWDCLQHPCDPLKDKRYRRWMDVRLSSTDALMFWPDSSLPVLETTVLPCLISPSRVHDRLNVPLAEEEGGLCVGRAIRASW